jgi:hypothetical protein
MLAIVVMGVLAAAVDDAPTQGEEFTPRAIVYAHPSSSVAMLGVSVVTHEVEPTLYAALGSSVRLSDRVAVDLELAGGDALGRFESGWIFSAGFGPSLQLTGDEPYRGAFVSMRFAFHAARPAQSFFFGPGNHGPIDLGPGISRAFMGEVDVGYHFRYGRVYFAPIIGIGVGYAYDYIDSTNVDMLSPFMPVTVGSSPQVRPQRIVWSLNLNLARLGAAL